MSGQSHSRQHVGIRTFLLRSPPRRTSSCLPLFNREKLDIDVGLGLTLGLVMGLASLQFSGRHLLHHRKTLKITSETVQSIAASNSLVNTPYLSSFLCFFSFVTFVVYTGSRPLLACCLGVSQFYTFLLTK